jgi:D-alanyl-D-alanine carboxypeptidase
VISVVAGLSCQSVFSSISKGFQAICLGAALTLVPAVAQAAKNAVIVIDANTGKTLYSESADATRHPASLTKMMTLYMVFERMQAGKLSKSTPLRVSSRAAGAAPSKLGLRAGSSISVEQAILALVTKSANDAAIVVSENLGGSESEFARMMTRKARALGMSGTTFRNASGLPDARQVTTARDMARLGIALREHFPRYYGYFKAGSFTYGGRTHRNHNKLLGRVAGVDGIKTGYIRASGFNLVTSAKSNGRSIVAVVMGGSSGAKRDARMRELVARYLSKGSRADGGDLVARSTAETPSGDVVVAAAGVELPKGASAPVPESRPGSQPELTAFAATPEPAAAPAVQAIDETITASLGAAPEAASASGWMVQIAAADSANGANDLLEKARAKASRALANAIDYVEPTKKNGQTLHRARFAGFKSQDAAVNACQELKKKKVSCFAVEG